MIKQQSKCTGCKALITNKGNFECRLGYRISYSTIRAVAVGPVPTNPCPKPKTFRSLKDARSLD